MCPKMYQRNKIIVYSNKEPIEAFVYIRVDDVGRYKIVENFDTYSRLTEEEFINTEIKEFKEKEHPEFYIKN